MKKALILLSLVLSFSLATTAQITLDNISLISITDKININYEKVYSYNFEVRFNDSIELWHTKQISRAEFQRRFYQTEMDSLFLNYYLKKRETKDKKEQNRLHQNFKASAEKAYLLYCDTTKPKFIKHIPKKIITDLLLGLQDSSFTKNRFTSQIELDSGVSFGNSIEMSSYFPLIGITVYSSAGDTLVVYNEGQQDLILPWNNKKCNTDIYNPIINWSLDAILPEEMSFNKKRLTSGLSK